jgi:hypothetical protein
MHFSKIVLKKGFGFVKVLARSGTWGARHNISDPEKKSINSAGAFFRHMRAPKKKSRRRSRKNSKKIFKKFSKKSRRGIFQKPFLMRFSRFQKILFFSSPDFFLKTTTFFSS